MITKKLINQWNLEFREFLSVVHYKFKVTLILNLWVKHPFNFDQWSNLTLE